MKLLLSAGILTAILLMGCGADPAPRATATPFPTVTPTVTPEPTATPTLLESEAILRSALESIQSGDLGDLTGPVLDVVCDVDAGDFAPAPDLTIDSVTDSALAKLAVREACKARQGS